MIEESIKLGFFTWKRSQRTEKNSNVIFGFSIIASSFLKLFLDSLEVTKAFFKLIGNMSISVTAFDKSKEESDKKIPFPDSCVFPSILHTVVSLFLSSSDSFVSRRNEWEVLKKTETKLRYKMTEKKKKKKKIDLKENSVFLFPFVTSFPLLSVKTNSPSYKALVLLQAKLGMSDEAISPFSFDLSHELPVVLRRDASLVISSVLRYTSHLCDILSCVISYINRDAEEEPRLLDESFISSMKEKFMPHSLVVGSCALEQALEAGRWKWDPQREKTSDAEKKIERVVEGVEVFKFEGDEFVALALDVEVTGKYLVISCSVVTKGLSDEGTQDCVNNKVSQKFGVSSSSSIMSLLKPVHRTVMERKREEERDVTDVKTIKISPSSSLGEVSMSVPVIVLEKDAKKKFKLLVSFINRKLERHYKIDIEIDTRPHNTSSDTHENIFTSSFSRVESNYCPARVAIKRLAREEALGECISIKQDKNKKKNKDLEHNINEESELIPQEYMHTDRVCKDTSLNNKEEKHATLQDIVGMFELNEDNNSTASCCRQEGTHQPNRHGEVQAIKLV